MKRKFHAGRGGSVKTMRRLTGRMRDWAGRVFAFMDVHRRTDSARPPELHPRMTEREIKSLTHELIRQAKDEQSLLDH